MSLITQSNTELQVGDASPDLPLGVILAVGIHLELRLQNQTLREEQLILGSEPGGRPARVANVRGRLDLEEIGREAFDAERQPVAGRAVTEVVACPGLRAPPAGENSITKKLSAGILGRPIEAQPFGL